MQKCKKKINTNEDNTPDKTDQRMQFARDILEKFRTINVDSNTTNIVEESINNEDNTPDETDQRMQFARDILEKFRKLNADAARSSTTNKSTVLIGTK